MSAGTTWKSGDRVIHTGKPEWGTGAVVKALASSHEGKACQRLTIRFARGGLKNISTAFARLESADDTPAIDAARDSAAAALRTPPPSLATRPKKKPPPGMLGEAEAPPDEVPLDPARAREIMTRVPDDARDPFRSLHDRFRATLKLYEYTPTAGSLVDWAARQSGVADPLSVFNRHELEQLFDRFAINRDQHLTSLLVEARRSSTDISALVDAAPSHARRVLNEINRRR